MTEKAYTSAPCAQGGEPETGGQLDAQALADLQALFCAALPEIEKWYPRVSRGGHCEADRDDRKAIYVARVWSSLRHLAVTHRLGKVELGSVLWNAAASALSMREFTGGMGHREPLCIRCRLLGYTPAISLHEAQGAADGEYAKNHGDGHLHEELEGFLSGPDDFNPALRCEVRLDARQLLKRLSRKARRIAFKLARSERTKDVATRFAVSNGRVSQVRREVERKWSAR